MFIASLNSGSNGNCYYVGNHHEAVLVDVGISCREVERRMKRLSLNMAKVKAIFVSHEHSDHIKGIAVLSRKYSLPVYITPGTLQYAYLGLAPEQVIYLEAFNDVQIGSLNVRTFPKLHDANDPHSFVISCDGINVGIFTDLGDVCEQLTTHFKQCHAAFLEANYDEAMLSNGRYPWFLKNRISGGKGHLSNTKALQLFNNHRAAHLTHLLLAHLSKDNNDPQLVQELFSQHANGVHVTVASRYEESQVFHITGKLVVAEPLPNHPDQLQYALF